MIEINLMNVGKSYGTEEILNNVNLEVRTGDCIGIVGENGCGKTTLFKMIMGLEETSKGKIHIAANNIGFLEQVPNYDADLTVADIIKLAFKEINNIEKEKEKLAKKLELKEDVETNLKKYSKLEQEYDRLDGYKTKENFNRICTGLKISEEFLTKKFNVLSGGEKTLILLAKILLEKHNVLLLDEPTNHLDMESIKWLEEYLKEYEGAKVIISHDRYFLDRIVDKIAEIEDAKLEVYPGNYTYYKEAKEEKQMQIFKQYNNQQKQIKKMKEAIVKLRVFAGASKEPEKFLKRAKAIEKRLEKMEKIEKPKEKKNIKLNVESNERSSHTVIKIKNLTKAFDTKTLFEKADMSIYYKEKVALIGNNGTGKSTLINMILDSFSNENPNIKIGNNIQVGYLEQQVKFSDEEQSILDYFRDGYKVTEEDARKYLAKFLFYGESVEKKLGNLSGGERSRIRLAKMVYSNVNFLILDEPTNHLDIDSIEVLEEALKNFDGTILMVSHDRYFLDKMANKIIELKDKKLTEYLGTYSYYLEKSQKDEKQIKEKQKEVKIKTKEEKKIKNKYRSLKDIEKDIEKVKRKLDEIENKINNIDAEIEENILDYALVETLVNEKNNLEEVQLELLEKWQELEEESKEI